MEEIITNKEQIYLLIAIIGTLIITNLILKIIRWFKEYRLIEEITKYYESKNSQSK